MPDPLSDLNSALEGRRVNEPERIKNQTGENTENALEALLSAILGTVRGNLGDAGGAVADRAGKVGGQVSRDARNIGGGLRSGFNAIPLLPDIGGGAPDRGPGAARAAGRLAMAPQEIAAVLRALAQGQRR